MKAVRALRRIFVIFPLIPLFIVLLGGGVVVSYMSSMTIHFKMDKTQEESYTTALLPAGLNEFSFFCFYESGGNYDCTSAEAYGAYQFDYRYELLPFITWCYAKDSVFYADFEPFLLVEKSTLYNRSSFAEAWHRVYARNNKTFADDQDAYKYEFDYLPLEKTVKEKYGIDLSARPKVIQGECLSIANRKGSGTFYRALEASGVTDDTSDEDFIKKLCKAFGTLDGRSAGNIVYDRWLVDYSGAACGSICEMNMALSILNGAKTYGGAQSLNNVTYYNQGDYPNVPFDTGSVASNGCGITSFSMVASYLTGQALTPDVTAPWAMANGANTVRNWGAFKVLANHYGITLVGQYTGPLYGGSADTAINALRSGCLVIGSHTGGYFNPSGVGHYIVYTGVTSDGRIYVNDPGSRARSEGSPYDVSTAFNRCKQYWIFKK